MKDEIKNHFRTWVFILTLGTVLIIIYKAFDSIGYIGECIKNLISVISPVLVRIITCIFNIYSREQN